MLPSTSAVDELCTELKLIARIVPDTKLHVGYRILQPTQSFLTALWRTITREDYQKTLKYIKEKTGRAIDYCDALLIQLSNPIIRDHFRMLRSDLSLCIAPDVGLRALRKTYDDKDQVAAELDVHIRKIEMRLESYRQILPIDETGSPLLPSWPVRQTPPFDSIPSPQQPPSPTTL